MIILQVGFGLVIVLLIGYIFRLKWQIRKINQQFQRRFSMKTKQPIMLTMHNKELIQLMQHLNQAMKEAENIRLSSSREEKKFREMIANISHDLRTPLTAVRGYQQLMDDGTLSPMQQNKLQIAQKHSQELGALIEQFFAYSYVVSREEELAVEIFDVVPLLVECIIGMIPEFEQVNRKIDFQMEEVIKVRANPEGLMRVIENLLRNGLRHGTGDMEIQIKVAETVTIICSNLIDQENNLEIERLFERFYTGDYARKKTTGLGLSIVQILVDQMGGSVGATLDNNKLSIYIELQKK